MSSYEPHVGPRQNLPWNLQTMSDGLQGGGYISMAGFYTGPKKNNIWNNEMNYREALAIEAKQQYKILTTQVPDYKYRVPNGISPVAPGHYMTPTDAEEEKAALSKTIEKPKHGLNPIEEDMVRTMWESGMPEKQIKNMVRSLRRRVSDYSMKPSFTTGKTGLYGTVPGIQRTMPVPRTGHRPHPHDTVPPMYLPPIPVGTMEERN